MKGKTKQRVMAVVLTLVMTISLLPLEFLGGGVAQVKAETTTYTFDPTVEASVTSIDKKAEIADGTTFTDGYFTTVGTVTRSNADAFSVELGKNQTGALQFTAEGTAKATFVLASTSSSNTTSGVTLTDADGNTYNESTGLTSVTGTGDGKTFVYENLPAGTYKITTTDGRGLRVFSAVVEVTVADAPVVTSTAYTFDPTVEASVTSIDKKAEIADGTTFTDGYFTTVGTVTRSNADAFSIELGKNQTGALQFTAEGTAKATFVLASTSSSNTTSGVTLTDADGNTYNESTGLTSVTGTGDGKTFVYENLPAGTYKITTTDGRGLRVFSAVVEVTSTSAATSTAYTFDPTVEASVTSIDKKAEIADGTTFTDGYFTAVGTVIRSNADAFSIELGKNQTGALQFTTEGTAKATFVLASTSSSNTTSGVTFTDADGNTYNESTGLTSVTGTGDGTTFVYENLPAGTYKITTTDGRGLRVFSAVVEVSGGTTPSKPTVRPEWDTVEKPVVNGVTKNESGTLDVDVSAIIGFDGADSARLFMYQNGYPVTDVQVTKSGVYTLIPTTEGDFTFFVIASRSGCADKKSDEYTYEGYTLPLSKPTITWVNNLGNGSVYIDWNNVEVDSFEVAYKTENDADYIVAATGFTEGNYTLTGLTPGEKYEVRVTAVKEGLKSSDTASFTVGDAAQQWYATLVGSATSGTITVNGTAYSLKAATPVEVENVTNSDGKVILQCNADGKIADSEDGILYYFTKINPNTENFKLSATFTVTDTSLGPDNQTGYGIYASDIVGFGTKDHKYFNSVSVGQFKMFGGFYHAHGARLITGYSSYDASNNAGAIRNLDNTNLFSLTNELDKVNVGDTFTYTLEKTNEGYVASVVGAGESILFEGATSIMEQEDGSIAVGIAAARKLTVEVSDIKFEKSEGSASAAAGAAEITPKVTVYSGSVSGTTDYEFIAAPNVDGWLDVFSFAANAYVYQGPVYADKIIKVPVTLKSGYNDIKYAFKGDENIPNLSTYAIIENTLSVAVQQWGAEGETIYVAPNASTGGAGTREEPLDLQTALSYAQPGQTIVMLDGTYYIEKDLVIPRSTNGTADKMITLTAENVGSVVIDGSKMEASSSLINMVGSYWHMYGIEFQNGLGKGVSVCGNHNIVELCTIHNVSNSGLQISRYAGEPNDNDMWPSYNLVKYCEAYDCCDPGRNDADGFAAKLTCGGGNKFYGCISHHNIDDGWDLYAKSTTGPIGAVTIENCVAYSNGFLTADDPSTMASSDFGEGNGFKLGGENMPGAHILKNCISYNNAGKGITSNSGPDCQIYNCTAFNNSLKGGSYNVSLYTKTSNPKAWVLDGMLSIAENGTTATELGSSNGVIYALRSATNYLYDGTKSVNNQGVQATSDWFVSTDITLIPTITVNGIDMHGLLELKDQSLNAGAKLVSWEPSMKPEATKTVSTKNVISFVGFNSVALGQAGSVKTGDTTPIASLLAIMVISAGICGAYVFRRKKSF